MNKKILGILLLTFFSVSLFIPITTVMAYKFPYPDEAIGVKVQGEIKIYDEEEWEDCVSEDLDPSDLYGGEADKEGAKCQTKATDFDEEEINIYDIIVLLNDLDEDDEEELDEASKLIDPYILDFFRYEINGKFDIWKIEKEDWDFTTEEEFDEKPDEKDRIGLIFQDAKDVVDIYNELNYVVFVQTSLMDGGPYRYNAKHIMWILFVEKGLPMAESADEYLEELTNKLKMVAKSGNYSGNFGPDYSLIDVDVDEFDLTITLNYEKGDLITVDIEEEITLYNAKDDFRVLITLSKSGSISMIQFFNDNGEVFFQYEGLPISDYHYIYLIPILLGIASISAIGIIYIIRKKKRS